MCACPRCSVEEIGRTSAVVKVLVNLAIFLQ
ncbi:hypothetical protein M6B38_356515 [Iris pallida]|uniref:Uncharacterized protein n=1 Tax=Iris pallida TaxID=29817 RepID=A0AAX6GLI7_IRIPA|nr:hypothetical protein M6B38_356515 [Iris pallida]